MEGGGVEGGEGGEGGGGGGEREIQTNVLVSVRFV